jgi:Ca2+-binding RTX toxin-like protein
MNLLTGSAKGSADELAPKSITRNGNIVIGCESNDFIHGMPENEYIYGKGGNDILHGDDGDDYIDPGTGLNTLSGGDGNDTFALFSAHSRAGDTRRDDPDLVDGGDGLDTVVIDSGWTIRKNTPPQAPNGYSVYDQDGRPIAYLKDVERVSVLTDERESQTTPVAIDDFIKQQN